MKYINTVLDALSSFTRKPTRKAAHVERINPRCTARKCVECQRPASFWRFFADLRGGIDRSSRQPVCSVHKAEGKATT